MLCSDLCLNFHRYSALAGLFILFGIPAYGQADSDFAKIVQGLASRGDYDALGKLIDAQETVWNNHHSIAYLKNMSSIADTLVIRGTTQQMYWMGRKVMWRMLLKPVPNEYRTPVEFYMWKEEMFLGPVEVITGYMASLSPEMFATIRHDTFLMLSEYVRQLHVTIIPGYRPKFAGAMNDAAGRKRLIQNAIDNQIQQEARGALGSLAADHINYLITTYNYEPRDDGELKTLMDILDLKKTDRDRVWADTH